LSLPARSRIKSLGQSLDVGRLDLSLAVETSVTVNTWSPGLVDDSLKVKSGKLVKVKSCDQGRDNLRQKVNDEEVEKRWKLMKRISTGGLRGRYIQVADKTLPHIPALLKD
jgi:hypothetical protein